MKPSVYLPRCRILFGLLLFALVPPLPAASLGLTPTFPDFVVDMNGTGSPTREYSYDATTKTLTINGRMSSYSETATGTQHTIITNNSFSLTAVFGNLSNCPGALCDADITLGDFSLFGEIHDGASFGTLLYDGFFGGFFAGGDEDGLLQGDLVDFGWAQTGGTSSTIGILEFTFGNTSGILATGPLTEGGNPTGYSGGGMILNVDTSNLGSGGADFRDLLTTSWTGTGVGNVFVPVPAALWLFGSGLAGLLGVGARRRRSI
jgi:hypothetical protein